MFRILKNEIEYFKIFILGIAVLPLIFTAFALNDILLFESVYFLKKYFWSMLVGLGIYALVFAVWSLRKKEMRERIQISLPVSVKNLALNRWLFGILPFLSVGLYIELLRNILPARQIIFVERINGQLGMLFIALVAVDLYLNSRSALQNEKYFKKIFSLFVTIVLLALYAIGAIIMVSYSVIKPLPSGGEEILFFIGGFILSVIDMFVYQKRKLFTE